MKFVRENEAKEVPQSKTSWLAVDRASEEQSKRIKKKAAQLRIKKWGAYAWEYLKVKKRKVFTKTDARKAAKTTSNQIATYNFLRAMASIQAAQLRKWRTVQRRRRYG